MKTVHVLILSGAILLVAGCGRYQILDPNTGETYYSTSVKRLGGGAVRFRDGHTGSRVTLQTSEVTRISGRDYKDALEALEADAEAGATE